MPALPSRRALPLLAPALLLCVPVLAGCGDDAGGSDADVPTDAGPSDGDIDAAPPPDASIELGTGVSAFEPLPESGGTLELVVGSQGGFHVFASVRFPDSLEANDAVLSYTLTETTSGESLILPKDVLLSERRLLEEGAVWVRLGDRLIFDLASPAHAAGREVEVTVTLETEAGARVTDARVVTLVDEE